MKNKKIILGLVLIGLAFWINKYSGSISGKTIMDRTFGEKKYW